jgi:hypothetical protein
MRAPPRIRESPPPIGSERAVHGLWRYAHAPCGGDAARARSTSSAARAMLAAVEAESVTWPRPAAWARLPARALHATGGGAWQRGRGPPEPTGSGSSVDAVRAKLDGIHNRADCAGPARAERSALRQFSMAVAFRTLSTWPAAGKAFRSEAGNRPSTARVKAPRIP